MVRLFYLPGFLITTAGFYFGDSIADSVYMRQVQKATGDSEPAYSEKRLSLTGIFMGVVFFLTGLFVTYGWYIQENIRFLVGTICQALGSYAVIIVYHIILQKQQNDMFINNNIYNTQGFLVLL
ncbi:hypothetical protein BDA99DRAFT_540544 [Phascolomyces articulosus]|uniref:Uncharacterized protein n=1 Tax=Phascolomyces articulosus TaxID=60185 RepID=A0AAD5K7A2_9FUNG|nr:hypothetical protein BDA99DRAFT_540544 [Phascolomyces articulosus]